MADAEFPMPPRSPRPAVPGSGPRRSWTFLAYAAARAALAGHGLAVPKDAHTSALRALIRGDDLALIPMSGNAAAAAADEMQAAYFKGFLEQERSESAARLAALTRRLTHCMTVGPVIHLSHLRGIIR